MSLAPAEPMLVLFCGTQFPEAPRTIESRLPDFARIDVCSAEEVDSAIGAADVVVPAMVSIGEERIRAAKRLRLIQQFATGVEGVDLQAAAARGIPVCNIPAGETGNSSAVAELALLHLVALLRRYPEASANVVRETLGVPVGRGLAGKRVVVLGVGAVGMEVVKKLSAYDVTIVCVSRRDRAAGLASTSPAGATEYFTLEELELALGGADALVVCMRYSPEVAGVVGHVQLAAMNPAAVVVNVARGPLVDHDALCDGLSTGHLSGAGLDVYWQEPPEASDRIFGFENVTVTPHVGAVTEEVYGRMAEVVAENLRSLHEGKPLRYRVA